MPSATMIGESQINNQKTLLVGWLIAAIGIGLIETNVIQFHNESILAQHDAKDLVLVKNSERKIIIAGSHVLVTNTFDPETYLAGTLVGINNGNIIIKDYRSGESKSAVVRDIGSLFYGERKRFKHYTLKGAGYGLKCSLLYGGAWFLLGASENMNYGMAFGAMATGCGAAVMIPSGSLFGYLNGLKKDKNAIEYIIGPNDWKIENQ